MKFLFLRNPRLGKKRLIELHERLELESGAGLHREGDDRREPKNAVAQGWSTRGVELGFKSGGVTKDPFGVDYMADPDLKVAKAGAAFDSSDVPGVVMHYRQIHLRSPVGPCPVAKRIGEIERQRIFGGAEFLIFEFIGQRHSAVQDSGIETCVGNSVRNFRCGSSRFRRFFLNHREITGASHGNEKATRGQCRHDGSTAHQKLPRSCYENFF